VLEDLSIRSTSAWLWSSRSPAPKAPKSTITRLGACFNEDSRELEERTRALFQDRVYFDATVKNLRIKVTDSLAEPTTLEAEVFEGSRFKVGEITFSGNRAVGSSELRTKFLISYLGKYIDANRAYCCLPDSVGRMCNSYGPVRMPPLKLGFRSTLRI